MVFDAIYRLPIFVGGAKGLVEKRPRSLGGQAVEGRDSSIGQNLEYRLRFGVEGHGFLLFVVERRGDL